MDYKEFRDACFRIALERGCDAAEAYYSKEDAFSVNVLEGEIETYEVNTRGGLNLRVKLAGRDGYAYTEALEGPEALVERAMDNARAIEDTDERPMQGKCEYPKIERKPTRADAMSIQDKLELSLGMERAAKAEDARVMRTMFCGMNTGKVLVRISNTLGLDANEEDSYSVALVMPVTAQDGDVRNAYSFRSGDGVFDTAGLVKEAVADCVMQHGASPVSVGKYRVLFRNDAMTDMLSAFVPMFSAEAAQKGLTLLGDKLGQKVADEKVSIIDDPFCPGFERAFDAEGVPSVTTSVVENGVLKSFLHNLKTAAKAGVASTSNAGRQSASSAVGIAPSNFYMKPGEKSFDELMTELGNGLLICEVGGLHAGLNAVSGEFSLVAKGMLVENGVAVRPVDQITVGGSFLSMLTGVVAVGNDMRPFMPGGSTCGCPSVLVDELMVSGQ